MHIEKIRPLFEIEHKMIQETHTSKKLPTYIFLLNLNESYLYACKLKASRYKLPNNRNSTKSNTEGEERLCNRIQHCFHFCISDGATIQVVIRYTTVLRLK